MDNPNINVTQNVGEVEAGGTVIGVQVVYQGEPVTIPAQEAIQLHRAELTKIEAYNRWADEFYIREEGKVLPLFASPYDDDGGRKREDLLQTIRAHKRLLALGEPGMGKTVALERMVWETAKADEKVVPILVQLLYFQGLELIELIRAALNETGKLTFDNAKSVRAFLRETKCLILFDGLNETPGRQREQVIGAIATFMREYPEHRYVVTSRSQDELWRKLRSAELIQDAVVVQTISDAQAQGYLQAHLGQEKGQALYDRLDASLKSLARTPLLLKLIKDAGEGGDQLPRNRGELFDKYVMNKLLEREQKLELTETPEVKKKALAHLAFALQVNHQLSCDREWAEKVLAEKGLGAKTETILKEALLHGLLIQQTLPDKQLLRFIHQSVQEYFVALTLLSEVKIEKNANLIQTASRGLSKHNLTAWAKEPWWSESFVQLAGLLEDANWLVRRVVNVSPWLAWWCVQEGRTVDEATHAQIEKSSNRLLHSNRTADRRRAAQTLLQFSNERIVKPLLQVVSDTDPEVVRLATQGLLNMDELTRAIVLDFLRKNDESLWKPFLNHLSPFPKSSFWIEVAKWVREEKPLLDEARRRLQKKVDSLDYQKGNLDSLSRKMVPMIALGRLETGILIDQFWSIPWGEPDWVTIPAGEFWMSGDSLHTSKIVHKVFLPEYQIARTPITNIQYAYYVKDSGAKAPEHWQGNKVPSGLENHPVTYVSWNDAMAYCKWLSAKLQKSITLPSEAEWEKAARGTDRREYPWGDWKDMYCNSAEIEIAHTTPVNLFIHGASPYGVLDMSGNVWEWTRSLDKEKPLKPGYGPKKVEDMGNYRLRGGAYMSTYKDVSCATKRRDGLGKWDWCFGFRVIIASNKESLE